MTTYERALKMLYRLIKSGVEYPEAEYKVVEYFRLQDAERLRQMYDESQVKNCDTCARYWPFDNVPANGVCRNNWRQVGKFFTCAHWRDKYKSPLATKD